VHNLKFNQPEITSKEKVEMETSVASAFETVSSTIEEIVPTTVEEITTTTTSTTSTTTTTTTTPVIISLCSKAYMHQLLNMNINLKFQPCVISSCFSYGNSASSTLRVCGLYFIISTEQDNTNKFSSVMNRIMQLAL
jgi:hypothetical protein